MADPVITTPNPVEDVDGYRCVACNRWVDCAMKGSGDPLEHCPHCGANNRKWIKLTAEGHLKLFPPWVWAAITLLLIIGSSAALTVGADWKPALSDRPWSVRLLSIFVIAISIFLYRSRHHLRAYEIFRQVLPAKWKPSLGWAAVLSVALAVILAVGVAVLQWVFTTETLTPISIRNFPYLPWLLYLFLTPAMAVAIMLLGTRTYVKRLDDTLERPIYCSESKLYEIVLAALRNTVFAPPNRRAKTSAGALEPGVISLPTNLECKSLRRNRVGGLDLVFERTFAKTVRDPDTREHVVTSESRTYQVKSNKWGEVLECVEQPASSVTA